LYDSHAVKEAAVPRGRPREFDIDQALERATEVFWRQGYEGTSITDLTARMGINTPSLYAAFGNKRQLFNKVMDRYMETRLILRAKALSLDDPVEAARKYLEGVVLDGTTPGLPKGCLMVGGALVCSDANRDVADQLAALRADARNDLQQLFARAVETGWLSADADADALGAYIAAVAQGISVEASGGASRQSLMRVVEIALSALPALATR
jgi:AcrR family transcriptional regulator